MNYNTVVNLAELDKYKLNGICLSIDPGISKIGWVVFQLETSEYINSGIITTWNSNIVEYRLREIYESITSVIESHKPDIILLEKIEFISYRTSKLLESIFMRAVGVITIACLNSNKLFISMHPRTVRRALKEYIENSSCINNKDFNRAIVALLCTDERILELNKKKKNSHISDAAALFLALRELYYKNIPCTAQ